ncbi:hypothetical protein AX774_g7507, partial [Zancudomyces culisetae]
MSEKIKITEKEIAVPYGLKKVKCIEATINRNTSKESKDEGVIYGKHMNQTLYTVNLDKGRSVLIGGRFSSEYVNHPDTIFNKNRAFLRNHHKYTVLTRGMDMSDILYRRYLLYFLSYVDLKESMEAIQPTLERVIRKEVISSGSMYNGNEVVVNNLYETVKNMVRFAIVFRFFGPYAIRDKDLIGSLKKATKSAALGDVSDQEFFSALFTAGYLGNNYIFEYFELESSRRKYLPEYIRNSECSVLHTDGCITWCGGGIKA